MLAVSVTSFIVMYLGVFVKASIYPFVSVSGFGFGVSNWGIGILETVRVLGIAFW